MKKTSLSVMFIVILIFTFLQFPGHSIAGVDVNIGVNFGPPPPVVISAPPPVVVIPETYVYFVPDVETDILFYHGYWYRPYQGRWHRATSYNGPWVYVEPVRVPAVLVHLPPNYRHVPPGHQRIPYGHLEKNWKTWEKEKHWDKHEARTDPGGSKGKGKHNN
jgi:hypothetical protein